MDRHPNYRSFLRIASVVTAVVLVFQSGLLDERSAGLFDQTSDYLAASVGMSVGVATTELNTLTAQLTAQRQLLAEREEAVAEREIAVTLTSGESTGQGQTRVTYLLAAALFVQLVLIVLNYGLDYVRMRDRQTLMTKVHTSG